MPRKSVLWTERETGKTLQCWELASFRSDYCKCRVLEHELSIAHSEFILEDCDNRPIRYASSLDAFHMFRLSVNHAMSKLE